jgi:hypothetical protein
MKTTKSNAKKTHWNVGILWIGNSNPNRPARTIGVLATSVEEARKIAEEYCDQNETAEDAPVSICFDRPDDDAANYRA